MPLSVSVSSNGRVSRGTDVVIPPENAGIGDLIYGTRSNFKVVARGTASSSTATNLGLSLYGCIYGFVAGMAMVCAPSDASGYVWKSSGSASSSLPTFSGSPLMRNGEKHTYVQMNTQQNASYITSSGESQPSDGLLTSAYRSTPLTSSSYSGSANAATKQKFGTWDEYIRQTLRVNGAPGTPFGAVTTGVKVHEFGRWMTGQIGTDSAYPAAYYCWTTFSNSKEGAVGTWWLPSMFELAELMIDEHYKRITENSVISLGLDSSRWSSVLYSADFAWPYLYCGMSYNDSLSNTYPVVRPVTLFKLV